MFLGIWREQGRRDIAEGIPTSHGESEDLLRVSSQRLPYQLSVIVRERDSWMQTSNSK